MTASPSAAPWGHPSRYYAEVSPLATRSHQGQPQELLAAFEKHWAELLEQASPGVRGTVERSYRQWNGILRDCIRTETALRLSVGDDVRAVPVRVVDGMPRLFAKAIQDCSGLDWLLLNRPTVEASARGTLFLEKNQDRARALLKNPNAVAQPLELGHVREMADLLLKELDKVEALERIIGIEEDVLGAYFFRVPEIRLYWMVIGIIASVLGVSPEALTIVVLAHELAHAYTHLGCDIDNEQWETGKFAETDIRIVEGLAQFYTEVICKRLEARAPTAIRAYNALLEKQSGPYRAHSAWVGDGERAGEIVRVAMIECRSTEIRDYENFNYAIGRHRRQVRGWDKAGKVDG